ncbi:MAG: hypothetical protein Q9163_005654 [Psora crenata]
MLKIIHSFPPHAPHRVTHPPKTLYILDSSFNPPTLAHLRICTTALLHDSKAKAQEYGRKRLLLLLATHNADKAPTPASFEQRVTMMALFAQDLLRQLAPQLTHHTTPAVDVGVTKLPLFVDKVREIEQSGEYGDGKELEQVHLIGFDTLTRLLDTKYYPPDHTLKPLEMLFGRCRVRVTRRTDDQWGGREEQDAYVRKLANGGREAEGGKRDWAERIELVGGRQEGEEVISSTNVREAVRRHDRASWGKTVSESVAKWILDEGVYRDDQ